MRAGKHVMIEIPMADRLKDSERLVRVQKETGLSPWRATRAALIPVISGSGSAFWRVRLKILAMDVQTFFFRRTNMNAAGKPRSWTDHLLWHHACHTVDLFQYQTGETAHRANALQGPMHPELKIAMDMSIQFKVPSGAFARSRFRSTTKGRSAHFSATSATTGHTSPAMTIWSMAISSRSIFRKWLCR